MNDQTPAEMRIVTTLNKAIDVYPLIQWHDPDKRNHFLTHFKLEFRTPQPHQATFSNNVFAPIETWFALFEDAEKEIMEDGMTFYGVRYQTTVKLAIKRLLRLKERVKFMNEDRAKKGKELQKRSIGYRWRDLDDTCVALHRFNETDEITMYFLFPEWPEVEVARKTEYVKEFEAKILKQKSQADPTPFDF